ncbi:MAG: ABC-2 transporter permease [Clostridiales bacterium]|nr:ABC-2 transporter permease [Clostridiales bacterium]
MTGLLYKDFVSIKGKKLTITYLVIFAVIIIMRLLMPSVFLLIEESDMEIADLMADGLYWAGGMLLFVMVFGTVVTAWPTKLVEDDKTRGRVIDYYSSLPVKKNQYIASHYVFIGIMAYVIFSFTAIWYVVGSSLSNSEKFSPLWSVTLPTILAIVCFGIVCAAIDLGSYISLGTSKGKVVRIAMFMILGTVILWYILFGDVVNVDTEMIVNWMMAHQFELSLFEMVGPFAAVGIYYLSYRISCRFCDKGAY